MYEDERLRLKKLWEAYEQQQKDLERMNDRIRELEGRSKAPKGLIRKIKCPKCGYIIENDDTDEFRCPNCDTIMRLKSR